MSVWTIPLSASASRSSSKAFQSADYPWINTTGRLIVVIWLGAAESTIL
jgi:hypothetical protein